MEGLSRGGKRELMDMDNTVVIMGGRGWVKVKEGIGGIKMVMGKNKRGGGRERQAID